MSNSVNTSGYGNLGFLTLGRQGLEAFSYNIGARVSEALEKPAEDLRNLSDKIDFLMSPDSKDLFRTYQLNIFNTSMALKQEDRKVNGIAPKLSIQG